MSHGNISSFGLTTVFLYIGERPYSCDLCDFKAVTASQFKRHKMIHTGDKPFQCEECGYSTTHKARLRVHKMIHTGEKPYKCDLCDYSARRRGRLREHSLIHTGELPYKCDFCDYGTVRPENLKSHKLVNHTQRSSEKKKQKRKDTQKNSQRMKQKINQAEEVHSGCDKGNDDYKHLGEDALFHTQILSRKCDDGSTMQTFDLGTILPEQEMPNQCSVSIDSTTPGHGEFTIIKRREKLGYHDVNDDYSAQNFEKQTIMVVKHEVHSLVDTTSDDALLQHENLAVKQKRKYDVNDEEERHILDENGIKSKQEMPSVDVYVGASMQENEELAVMQRQESSKDEVNDGIANCAVQNIGDNVLDLNQEMPNMGDASDNSMVQNQEKVNVEEVRNKIYMCDACDYKTTLPKNLKRHKRKHTGEKPYRCDLCNFTTAYHKSMKEHNLRHTGQKPYKCNVCDYSTTQCGNLKRHMVIHTGQKPYKCDVCKFSTAHSESLKSHMVRHVREKLLNSGKKYE